ncbi:hypothetical protein [Pseudoalteromonas luteoviolacea]|uniref:hypothetical protein n=1 Tax=Pseudoalteromonas luteoviolacea TaxID=43657 RepID=UPI001B38E811|nr:hypothetical protein [Pseudoalteromonas luteoviolacea]MBQ4835517.1 hypothetical protein [Pseudoalteromonas luteoviolacea]
MGKSKQDSTAHYTAEQPSQLYTDQNKKRLPDRPITSGKFFEALRDIYVRYCGTAAELDASGSKIVAFSVDYETRKTDGLWSTHPCYRVHFSNHDIRPFSIPSTVPS